MAISIKSQRLNYKGNKMESISMCFHFAGGQAEETY